MLTYIFNKRDQKKLGELGKKMETAPQSYVTNDDEDYITWEEVQDIIKTNSIYKFKRPPSGSKEYQKFKDFLNSNKISATAILLGDDLKWAKVDSNYQIIETNLDSKSGKLLYDKDDIKIIMNKFPYHFEPNVTHLLVWTKVTIDADPECPKGDISPYTRKLIDKYVQKTFVQGLGISPDNVVWFRNWRALQSIPDLSHIHVLIKDLPTEQLQSILNTPGVPLEDSDYMDLAQL